MCSAFKVRKTLIDLLYATSNSLPMVPLKANANSHQMTISKEDFSQLYSSALLRLPVELIQIIASCLDETKDTLRLSATCKHLYSIIDHSNINKVAARELLGRHYYLLPSCSAETLQTKDGQALDVSLYGTDSNKCDDELSWYLYLKECLSNYNLSMMHRKKAFENAKSIYKEIVE